MSGADPLPEYLEPRADGVVVRVWAKPRASRTRVAGVQGNALAIQLAAPPVDGAANAELTTFLARTVGIPRGQVEILSGDGGRHKRVLLTGVAAAHVAACLASGP